jgi:hypothetical protein
VTWCYRDGRAVDSGDAVLVGSIEQGSGPGRVLYACPACVASYDLLPLEEHPPDSDGTPRRRTTRGPAGDVLL